MGTCIGLSTRSQCLTGQCSTARDLGRLHAANIYRQANAFTCRWQARPPAHRSGMHTGDDHQMVQCEEYAGAPGSGAPGAQPFRVLVAPAAELMMDFHAHLSLSEVIGLLGGSWDADMRVLRCGRALSGTCLFGGVAART